MSSERLIGATVCHSHERGVVQAVQVSDLSTGVFHLLVLLPMGRLRSWRFDEIDVERSHAKDAEHDSPPELRIGEEYDLEVRMRVRVTDSHDGHGLCYHTVLTDSYDRGYRAERQLDLDADEILRASRR